MGVRIIAGDCLTSLRTLPDASFDCVVTSPPYWGLRSYIAAGNPLKRYEIGLEPTLGEHLDVLVEVFREVRRVLKIHGTLWLNYGDCYAARPNGKSAAEYKDEGNDDRTHRDKPFSTVGPIYDANSSIGGQRGDPKRAAVGAGIPNGRVTAGGAYLKPKDLCMVANRLAIALQEDGWWVRSEIIWCLSGGTWVYARTQKGDMPMMVRDLARLRPGTAQLWNGSKWTALLGMSKSARRGDELEIVLRSGERISCTPTHRFPTKRGLLSAGDLKRGDVIETCRLPPPERPRDCAIDEDAAWFAGLYLAEGSRSGDCIQISGHAKEEARWERVQRIAAKFGGSATQTIAGNERNIRVRGRILNAIIDELVAGRTAADKGFSSIVWRYSDTFIASMLTGYLSGDGHWDAKNKRWRLGFTRNYNLERDLRVACSRLGYHLSLRPSMARYQGGVRPAFHGELRMERSGHHNQRDMGEVVEVRKARCREVYDLGVADEPHLFALASGVLTHNSKPNPMPESVYDRPTTAHEKVWLLTKSEDYFYNHEAIREPVTGGSHARVRGASSRENVDRVPRSRKLKVPGGWDVEPGAHGTINRSGRTSATYIDGSFHASTTPLVGSRNSRNVWTIAPRAFRGAHFATFSPALAERCIKAGCPPTVCGCCGAVSNCGALCETFPRAPGRVLDPFGGAGTVGLVADKLGLDCTLIELNPDSVVMAERRIKGLADIAEAAE